MSVLRESEREATPPGQAVGPGEPRGWHDRIRWLAREATYSATPRSGAALIGPLLASLVLRRSEHRPLAGALALMVLIRGAEVRHARLIREVRNSGTAVSITPQLPDSPLVFGDFAIDADFAKVILGELARGPRRVLECGSGVSTLLQASYLEAVGEGTVVSLEHDEHWARQTRSMLAATGLSHRAQVINAPLTRQVVDETEVSWYDVSALKRTDEPFDLLVVDGPPTSNDLSRWPVVQALRDQLAPNVTILLDDGRRRSETLTARRWLRDLGGGELFWIDTVKGAWKVQATDLSTPGRASSMLLKSAARCLNPRPSGFGLMPVRR
jgi:hypothetical protein